MSAMAPSEIESLLGAACAIRALSPGENRATHYETLMRLALEAESAAIQDRAAALLLDYGIRVEAP